MLAAALDLCGRDGLGALTRRRVAEQMGCSKRTVSKHFGSGSALVQAVIDRARLGLGTALERVIAADGAPALDRLDSAFLGVLEAVRQQPGIGTLLTTNASDGVGAALDHLRDAPRALARELIREAKTQGALSSHLSTAGSADAWATLLLGAVAGGLDEAAARSLLAFWKAGLGALEGPEPEGAPAAVASLTGTDHIRALDVRPVLASGRDPLSDILPVLDSLTDDQVLVLLAPFRPGPLLTLMAKKGFRAEPHQLDEQSWSVEVTRGDEIEDLRELEAPLPLERVLTREGTLEVHQTALARLPRYPRMLVEHLDQRDVDYELWSRPDGAALLWMRKRG